MFDLSFTRNFCFARRFLSGTSEKHAMPHGFEASVTIVLAETVTVELDGKTNKTEIFDQVKAIWTHWVDKAVDGAMQCSEADPLLAFFAQYEPQRLGQIMQMPGDPTTELLACCMMAKIKAFLQKDQIPLDCLQLQIEAPAKNILTFTGDPAASIPQIHNTDPWWNRPDMSINNFPYYLN